MTKLNETIIKQSNNPGYGYNSKDELFKDTQQHKEDVYNVFNNICHYMMERAFKHDWTKLEYFDDFAKDTLERLDTPDFKKRAWYNIHTVKERHHVNANVPENVNLFDLLEMQVDCICAGLSRFGDVDDKFLEIPDDVLKEAYWNTVKVLKESIGIMGYLE